MQQIHLPAAHQHRAALKAAIEQLREQVQNIE